jgi:hypothetical protein
MTSSFRIVALCRDTPLWDQSESRGRVVEFIGGDCAPHKVAVSLAALHAESKRVVRHLAKPGLTFGRDGNARLLRAHTLIGGKTQSPMLFPPGQARSLFCITALCVWW